MVDLNEEAYRLAMAYRKKPWARRWLKEHGRWNALTVPKKSKQKAKAKEVEIENCS